MLIKMVKKEIEPRSGNVLLNICTKELQEDRRHIEQSYLKHHKGKERYLVAGKL
jgi:hypothetical protein